MDHKDLPASEFDLIANKKIADAKITKVWEDIDGNVYVELVYEKEK